MILNSPFYNILTVPNSIWRLELVDHFRISAGMLTDYLLYRHHGLDPGILYTPIAGLTWYSGKWPAQRGISVFGGYARFLEF